MRVHDECATNNTIKMKWWKTKRYSSIYTFLAWVLVSPAELTVRLIFLQRSMTSLLIKWIKLSFAYPQQSQRKMQTVIVEQMIFSAIIHCNVNLLLEVWRWASRQTQNKESLTSDEFFHAYFVHMSSLFW